MDGAIDAAAIANNYAVSYGDVVAGFVTADRIGATVEILPDYGSDGQPSGQRHAFLHFMTGSSGNEGARGRLSGPLTAPAPL